MKQYMKLLYGILIVALSLLIFAGSRNLITPEQSNQGCTILLSCLILLSVKREYDHGKFTWISIAAVIIALFLPFAHYFI